jgi:hypothetical protein
VNVQSRCYYDYLILSNDRLGSCLTGGIYEKKMHRFWDLNCSAVSPMLYTVLLKLILCSTRFQAVANGNMRALCCVYDKQPATCQLAKLGRIYKLHQNICRQWQFERWNNTADIFVQQLTYIDLKHKLSYRIKLSSTLTINGNIRNRENRQKF